MKTGERERERESGAVEARTSISGKQETERRFVMRVALLEGEKRGEVQKAMAADGWVHVMASPPTGKRPSD
jgi:hypothetical protein